MSREMYDENYPIAVLIEELRNEDVQFRLNSIKKLSTIAVALGPEKTRTQLIPFLTESVYDEDDVLVALTEQLIKLIPHIGGPSQIKVLLSLLETLGTVEETAVREKAVQVLRQMAPYFSFEDMRDHYFPLVQRFATAQWFATKISATGLFAVVYPRVDETLRSRILDMVVDLARDELHTVRTAIATKLGELAMIMLGQQKMDEPQKLEDPDEFEFGDSENVDPGVVDEAYKLPESSSYPALDLKVERERVIEKLIPVITMLWPDDNDTVRLMAFESAVLIAKGLASTGNEEPDRYLIKLVHYAAVDKSWRVRCVVANKFPMIIEAFGRKVIIDELYAVFIKLLKDNESEVKVLSVNRAKDFAYLMAGVPLPPDMSEEITSTCSGGAGQGQQNWTGGDSPMPGQDKTGLSSTGLMSANNAITTASTLLSCGETTLGSQMQAKVASINGHSKAQPSLTPVSADTDNFIFKFNSLSNSLSYYKDHIPRMKEAEKMIVDTDESIGSPISNCPVLMQQLIPTLKELQMDTSPHVRVSLANVVMQLVPLCGREITIKDLMPIILSLLKDECQEVRLNLIVRFDYLTELIGMETFTNTLMPLIVQLASDRKWRVRLGIMDYLLLLAEKFGEQFFTEETILLCLSWLIDHSYAIRLAAVINISKLAAIFGHEWTRDKLIPNILELAADKNYLHRMICIQTLMSLSEVISPDITKEKLVPCVLQMSQDKVPNVRFKVAQSLCNLGKNLDRATLENTFKPVLQKFVQDPDNDVQYFAKETAENLAIQL